MVVEETSSEFKKKKIKLISEIMIVEVRHLALRSSEKIVAMSEPWT